MTKKSFIIWGCSGHAKVLMQLIETTGNHVTAFFDNAPETRSIRSGIPIYIGTKGFEEWNRNRAAEQIFGLVAIGGGRGRDRLEIQQIFAEAGIMPGTVIHPAAHVCSSARIGTGSQILAMSNIAADVEIGRGCIINHMASIDHECSLGDGCHVAPAATLCGCIAVGSNVFIGAGATVLPRIRIGDNATIGAGAVVTHDVPPGVTVVGNPARAMKPFSIS